MVKKKKKRCKIVYELRNGCFLNFNLVYLFILCFKVSKYLVGRYMSVLLDIMLFGGIKRKKIYLKNL